MKRWWGIRHLRWLWHSRRFWRWWMTEGPFDGTVPTGDDLRHLDDIREGRA